MHVSLRSVCFCVLALALSVTSILRAQQPPLPPGQPPAPMFPSMAIVIPEEPKGIDPVTLLSPKLAAKAKNKFAQATLPDVARWLQEQKLATVLDEKALADAGIDLSEPLLDDELDNQSLYLLLNRLSRLNLTWYEEDGLVHITTPEEANVHLRTVQYNVGDLLDADFQADSLTETVTASIGPTTWDSAGGPGNVVLLGDVLFVSQTEENHLQVAGLLAALRKHARRTYIVDEPSHEKLRAALDKPVSLDIKEQPLSAVVAQLAKLSGVDIRLDSKALSEAGIRGRQPTSVTINEQKLRIVLRVLLDKHNLTWLVRDGVLWITSPDTRDANCVAAVYDVRDLCRDESEAVGLKDAVENQLSGIWSVHGGPGEINFPKPGAMVVFQSEQNHDRLLALLESYRAALRASKPRPQPGKDPKEVITRYYRMPTAMANDLAKALPQLVEPETWQTDAKKDAPGTILLLASKSQLEAGVDIHIRPTGKDPNATNDAVVPGPVLVAYSVLVIKQTRGVHDKIPELLTKIERGEAPTVFPGGMGGMGGGGMGGNGFGGGFFSVPAKK